jgi:hypothetical protein
VSVLRWIRSELRGGRASRPVDRKCLSRARWSAGDRVSHLSVIGQRPLGRHLENLRQLWAPTGHDTFPVNATIRPEFGLSPPRRLFLDRDAIPVSRPSVSKLVGWLVMFSRNGRRNKAQKACTCFRVPGIRASQYGVSGEHGGPLWRKLAYRISRYTICVTCSARVSVGSLQTRWCSARCGTAVQRRNAIINSEWLTKFVRASNEPTNEPIKTRKYYVLTTVRSNQRNKLLRGL